MKQRSTCFALSFTRRALWAVGLVLAVAQPLVQAAPPEAMTYQGYLVDGNGNPLATNNPANYPVIFRIFAAASGGASLWSEQQIVTVDKGNFSVILSEGTPVGGEPKPLLSAVMGTNGADRYIQLSVTISGSTLNMLPRMRLLPSPFAFLSTSANQLVNPAGAAVVTYASSRVQVAGNLFASGTISGNGSGLTGLTAAQLPNIDASKITSGTLADARLSTNVALLTDNNAFVGNQTISGNLGLGTPNTTFPLTIGNNTHGDKISLYGQSGNSFGFGVQSSLLQIHSDQANSDIAFGYGSSAAFTEVMRIEGTGNVGIGTNSPTGKLTVNGGVRARGGAPGANGVNNNGYAFTGSGNDDSGMFSSADGQVEFYTQNTERMRINSAGNVGIGTINPGVKLDVNGAIRATNLAISGTITATNINGTVNGEKPSVTYTIAGDTALWRDVLIDATILFGDADGGKFRVLLRNHSTREVRTVTYEFYAENNTDNFSQATRHGWSISSYADERSFWLGGTATQRYDIASNFNWFWVKNYRGSQTNGGVDGPAFGAADRYKFYLLVPPTVSATIILYDR